MSARSTLVAAFVVTLALSACSASGGESGSGLSGSGGSPGSGGSGIVVGGGSSAGGSSGGGVIIPDEGEGGADGCDSVLEVVYRDFSEAHADFEMPFKGDVVRRGLVEAALGSDQKPVFKSNVGCPADPNTPLGCDNWTVSEPVITSAETFAQWYTEVPDVNLKFERKLELLETAPGSGQYVFESDAFFPLGPDEGFGVAPANHHLGRNFLFTTEIHVLFEYKKGQKFSFRGDDDLWIFVNGKLAMDLGSMHSAEPGTIDFDAQAADLGISVGSTYPMDIFHAERHTDASNFKFETNISCFEPVVVK